MVVISMNRIHPDLLRRYALGECTEKERLQVEAWLETGDEFQEEYTKPDPLLKAEIWSGIVQKANRPHRMTGKRNWFYGLAAACALVIAFSILFLPINPTVHIGITAVRYVAPKGKMVKLILPDGTSIQLAGGSVLEYPRTFNADERKVHLITGEVFFSINQQAGRPFVLHAAGAQIRVLGTRFNVNYTDTKTLEVTLTQGSISFAARQQKTETLLKPGQRLRYHRIKASVTSIEQVDTNEVTSWITGTLYFKQTHMREALSQLENRYKVRFKILGKPDLDVPLTGKFSAQPISKILNLIENSTKIRFKQTNAREIIVN
ncbi:FecR family protein [bacterium A37T11]|nr:FecR family protein [bacterium A37T11]